MIRALQGPITEARGWKEMEAALIIVNVVAGAGGAYLFAHGLRRIGTGERSIHRLFGVFASVYFVECVAMVLGVGIPVYSIFLSFVWAAVFGMHLSKWESKAAVRKTSFILSIYTSLPVMTFVIVPITALAGGRDIAGVGSGIRFDVPQHTFVPPPLGTILGFHIMMAAAGFALKTLITMGGVALVARGGKEAA